MLKVHVDGPARGALTGRGPDTTPELAPGTLWTPLSEGSDQGFTATSRLAAGAPSPTSSASAIVNKRKANEGDEGRAPHASPPHDKEAPHSRTQVVLPHRQSQRRVPTMSLPGSVKRLFDVSYAIHAYHHSVVACHASAAGELRMAEQGSHSEKNTHTHAHTRTNTHSAPLQKPEPALLHKTVWMRPSKKRNRVRGRGLQQSNRGPPHGVPAAKSTAREHSQGEGRAPQPNRQLGRSGRYPQRALSRACPRARGHQHAPHFHRRQHLHLPRNAKPT
jgi:hypothetical protein